MNSEIRMNQVSGDYFDTFNTITSPAPEHILQAALDECAVYNQMLSKFVPGSDVWKINHSSGQPVEINEHTRAVLEMALEMNQASDGAFNIALGPTIALWHFTDGTAVLPDPAEIKKTLAKADCSQIVLLGNTVQVPEGTEIDLGGIAKGYICDCIADSLRARGVTSALLNFGGNVVTVGNRPDGKAWTIGLQRPSGERGKEFWAAVKSCDSTLVTSGIYERSFHLNGVTYHHILDPRTGWPVQNHILTVTAITKSSLLADAITTALFVLGPAKGLNLAQRYGVSAVYLRDDGKVFYDPDLDIVFVK